MSGVSWNMPMSRVRELARQFILGRRLPKIRALLQQLWPRYGGHPLIRFGPDSDGGYLLPDDLEGVVACFSPGVCNTSGFELDCARRGIPVFLADASVDGPAETCQLFQFTKKFIGKASHGDFITLQQWVTESLDEKQGDLLLQMDIEGFEYEVLNSTDEQLLKRFRIIIIEFHNLRTIMNGRSTGWRGIRDAFERLLKTHLVVQYRINRVIPRSGNS